MGKHFAEFVRQYKWFNAAMHCHVHFLEIFFGGNSVKNIFDYNACHFRVPCPEIF